MQLDVGVIVVASFCSEGAWMLWIERPATVLCSTMRTGPSEQHDSDDGM
jgi:hypothetical protein